MWFQCTLSLPSPGYFSPFPHGTLRYRWVTVLSLGGWAPQLPAGFLVSRGTRVAAAEGHVRFPTGFSPSRTGLSRPFSRRSCIPSEAAAAASLLHPQPRWIHRPAGHDRIRGLGSPPFARHYLGDLIQLISFPQGTEMFQFPWFPRSVNPEVALTVLRHDSKRVSPFGHLWINAC